MNGFKFKSAFLLIGLLTVLTAVAQVRVDQTTTELASKYFAEKEFARAAPLFKDIYLASGNATYFRYYIQCLAEMGEYAEAETEVRKEIRKSKTPRPELHIHLGYLLKMGNKTTEATAQYLEAFRVVPANRSAYVLTANHFMQWREYEMAEQLLMAGRDKIPGEKFNTELAQIYLYLRNYSRLIEELLEVVKSAENQLPLAQSYLTSAMYMDIENGVREEFRSTILKRIQTEPEVAGYSRLLIWFFLQEKQFAAALRQSIALDRRTGGEEIQILNLAQMALNNQNYGDAEAAFSYVLEKGKENPNYIAAYLQKLHAGYLRFTNSSNATRESAATLALQFEEGIEVIGYNSQSISLLKEYAHLLAFYLGETQKAINILEKGLSTSGLRPQQTGELKTGLADIYVYAGDPWEATLLYSQVIDANRDNALGDQVKLKKARLGYFLGNFSWARAQLDVLKASTSKLTANDAMELSLFIGDNADQDSTETALIDFARADLLFFRHQDQEALALLDSITSRYPWHALGDDILLRKARIEDRQGQYTSAISLLEKITTSYAGDLLADDALFMMAEIWHYKLHDAEKAAQAYKEILFSYPGSIYVSEARSRYREQTPPKNTPEIQEGSDPTLLPPPSGEKERKFFKGGRP